MSEAGKTFFVFHGQDEFNIAAQVKVMRAQMDNDFNTTEFDGAKTTVGDVLAAAQILPFLGDKRLVIVYGMLSHLNSRSKADKGDLERLAEALPTLPATARLVFVEYQALTDKHPVLKVAQQHKNGFVKLLNPPDSLIKWIEQAAKGYGVQIQPYAASVLSNVVGKDVRAADSEVFKLACYVGEGGTITPEHVALLTSYVADADIFAMVDALGQRNGQVALDHLKRLLQDSEPLQLFGMIIRQFRLLIMARDWVENGGSSGDLAQAIGVHPFVAKKITEQARSYRTTDELEQIYRSLLETDVDIKTGKVKDYLGLELFVARLARGD